MMITNQQNERYQEYILFTEKHVEPDANEWDKIETLPMDILETCAQRGYLGAMIPTEFGGQGLDHVTYGLMNEAIGYGSISLSGLFNVHTMIAQVINKWGTDDQKSNYLPAMAQGKILGALAITEPGAGSDMSAIETTYTKADGGYVINGTKRWITMGGIADVFLVFGKLDGKPIACLVDRKSEGLTISQVDNMLGFKAGHLAILQFDQCFVPTQNLVGQEDSAFTCLAPYALEYGRISVAFSGLGLLRACLEICSSHVLSRKTFSQHLISHGVISQYITDMGIDYEAARLLCLQSVALKDQQDFGATESIMKAKYFVAKAANKHASVAVQMMGAMGCNEEFAVSRFYRDSKILGIIEGSNEIHQMLLGQSIARKHRKRKPKNK